MYSKDDVKRMVKRIADSYMKKIRLVPLAAKLYLAVRIALEASLGLGLNDLKPWRADVSSSAQ